MYKITSLQPVLDCFQWWVQCTPSQIADTLGKSKVLVHKYLKELVAQWKLRKIWSGVHIVYELVKKTSSVSTPLVTSKLASAGAELSDNKQSTLSYDVIQTIQESFYKFAENGKMLEWIRGFNERCVLRNLPVEEKANTYYKVKKHIDMMKNKCWVIETYDTFSKHVHHMYLDKVYYADQYNWMEFGRWKLAEMTFFAKQSQNIKLINACIELIIHKIACIVEKKEIDSIAIVPPSIARVNQLLKILQKKLAHIGLPVVKIVKYYPNKIPVPQKSLKTREQRLRNAQETILIAEKSDHGYKKTLLIDDFVWSGSSLNETAGKLKEIGIKKVYGFAFVGNTNLTYDVINEV